MVGSILSSSLWKETAIKEEKTWKVHLAVETILILQRSSNRQQKRKVYVNEKCELN